MGKKGMNDLISRTALLEEIKLQKWYAGEIQNQSYRTGFIASLSILEGKITEIPAVDAQPVRHGRWIDVWIRGVLHHRCTECDSYIEHIWTGSLGFDRCPKCGAKMDAEVNDHGSDSTEQSH